MSPCAPLHGRWHGASPGQESECGGLVWTDIRFSLSPCAPLHGRWHGALGSQGDAMDAGVGENPQGWNCQAGTGSTVRAVGWRNKQGRPGTGSCRPAPLRLCCHPRGHWTPSALGQRGRPRPCTPGDPSLTSAVPVWRGRRRGLQRTHGLRAGVPSSSHPATGPGEWRWGMGGGSEPSL